MLVETARLITGELSNEQDNSTRALSVQSASDHIRSLMLIIIEDFRGKTCPEEGCVVFCVEKAFVVYWIKQNLKQIFELPED
jgi:hypothetical protein